MLLLVRVTSFFLGITVAVALSESRGKDLYSNKADYSFSNEKVTKGNSVFEAVYFQDNWLIISTKQTNVIW